MKSNELKLSLEVIAEADNTRSTLLNPSVPDLLELVRVNSSLVKLDLDEGVERVAEVELKLAVQQALLSGIESDRCLRFESLSHYVRVVRTTTWVVLVSLGDVSLTL